MIGSAPWISPAKVTGLLEHVDTDDPEVGLALLHAGAGKKLSVSDLVRAKLQPREPTAAERERTIGWPVTAADHRLVLAQGVPDPRSLEELFAEYDEALPASKNLIAAAVLTLGFSAAVMRHDMMTLATMFAQFKVARARRCSCLIILHAPGDGLSHHDPHIHIVILTRRHRPSGWQALDPDMHEGAGALWADEWAGFAEAWGRGLA